MVRWESPESHHIRRCTQALEDAVLSPFAQRSRESRGPLAPEEPCSVRTVFQRDRDRIIHSKAFRRLKGKTQVFLDPQGDHFRTRLTHTLEVAQIARTIARGLGLNEDLTEAIALGHDLGHTPYGHAGERVLDRLVPWGFRHNEQSLRIVDHLEKGGLNLTWEVREGIRFHTGPTEPTTLEARVTRIADRMAYINHDIDDALRAGIISLEEMPQDALAVLGKTHGARIHTMVSDMIHYSRGKNAVALSPRVWDATNVLRDFMMDAVYLDSPAKREEGKAQTMLEALYHYYVEDPSRLEGWAGPVGNRDPHRLAADYLAGMTDRFAVIQYQKAFLPSPWRLEESVDTGAS